MFPPCGLSEVAQGPKRRPKIEARSASEGKPCHSGLRSRVRMQGLPLSMNARNLLTARVGLVFTPPEE